MLATPTEAKGNLLEPSKGKAVLRSLGPAMVLFLQSTFQEKKKTETV